MLKTIGIALLCAFVVLDAFVRFRLKSIGKKWAFLLGGTLDYTEYLRECERRGWPTWPMYAMWMTLIAGLGLFLAGFIFPRR